MSPIAPAVPVGPAGPTAPVAPAAPVGPIAPIAPAAPVGPVAPQRDESITGDYLSGRKKIEVPANRRKIDKKRQVTVVGARENNLEDLTARFPLYSWKRDPVQA